MRRCCNSSGARACNQGNHAIVHPFASFLSMQRGDDEDGGATHDVIHRFVCYDYGDSDSIVVLRVFVVIS